MHGHNHLVSSGQMYLMLSGDIIIIYFFFLSHLTEFLLFLPSPQDCLTLFFISALE